VTFLAPLNWDFAVQDDFGTGGTDYLAAWSDIAGQDNQAAALPGAAQFNPGLGFDFIIYSNNGPVPGGAGVDPGSDPMNPFPLVDVGTNEMNQMVSDTITEDFTETPEPGTLGRMCLGAVGMAALRMRTRRASDR
jgi:hypothetical protein